MTVVDTGLKTMTGGRIKRIEKYIGSETFMMTYGDGVSDINIGKLVEFHRQSKKKATLTAVQIEQRFGVLDINNGTVQQFREKSKTDGDIVNAGYMVLEPAVFRYLQDDQTIFEQEPLKCLAEEGELASYVHRGFWQCMDTKKEHDQLNELWDMGRAPWKAW